MMFAIIYEVADDGSWHTRAADLPAQAAHDAGMVDIEVPAVVP